MTINPDRACRHENFAVVVEVNRIAEDGQMPHAYIADIRVTCVDCEEPFRWTGLRAGVSFAHPDGLRRRARVARPSAPCFRRPPTSAWACPASPSDTGEEGGG